MLNGASMFFNSCIHTYIYEDYIILRLFILVNGYGIVGVIILFLMIATAFLRLCITLGPNEFLGCYCNRQIYFLLFQLLDKTL